MTPSAKTSHSVQAIHWHQERNARFPPPFPADWFWQLQLQWAMWINLAFCYLSSIFPWIDWELWAGRYINFSPRNCVSFNVSRLKMTKLSTFNDEIPKPNLNLVVHPNCYQSLLMTLNKQCSVYLCVCVCRWEIERVHIGVYVMCYHCLMSRLKGSKWRFNYGGLVFTALGSTHGKHRRQIL